MNVTRIFNTQILLGDQASLGTAVLDASANAAVSAYFCNVHMLMIAQEDPALAADMAGTELVIPDGVPIAWLQRRLGHAEADVLRGYQAVNLLCERAAREGRRVGFFGSTQVVLDALRENLLDQHPGLDIAWMHSPPMFSEITIDDSLVQAINALELDCLFVGLGCPKQEHWVAAYREHLNCSLLAVGAAFDWLAETTPRPPGWMERSGLGWLHRLLLNPRRMWRRYLVYNTRFIGRTVKLLLFDKKTDK